MESFQQPTYLNQVQRSTETHLPPAVLQQLEQIARQGFDPHLIMQHYTASLEKGQPQELSVAAPALQPVLDDSPSPDGSEKLPCGCPWCGSIFKQEKDFIRHVKEICCAEAVFRCPDCPKKYTRKHRLARHHEKAHPARCGPGACSHVGSATIKLNNTQTLGCGFCSKLFHGPLHAYLRHVIDHYRAGALLADWQAGPHTPMPKSNRPFSPPPQINLSCALENQGSLGDFSAFRSGFGLDDSPDRTYSAISNDSTLFDMMDYTTHNTNAKANWDPYFNPTNMAFIDSMPMNDHPPMQQNFINNTTQLNHPEDDFTDMMQYINDNPDFINNNFVDTSLDNIIPQSQAVTACAQLMNMDPAVEAGPSAFPPFNPTPPLDLIKERRTSMSGRLLRKMQSLSPLRTEF